MNQRPLRIAWITPSLRGRGVTTVCEEAAKSVAQLTNHDVHLVCAYEKPPNAEIDAPVTIHDLRLPRNDRLSACNGMHKWIKLKNPDVVLFNDTPAIEPYWPYVPRKVRTIGVLHDIAYGWKRPFIDCKHYLDGIVAVSDFVYDSISKSLSDFPGIFATVENGVSIPNLVSGKDPSGILHLVFFGAIDRQKGAYDLPAIVKAVSALGIEFKLSILGGTDLVLAQEIERAAKDNEIIWYGRLERAECFKILRKAHVYLALSRSESFGLTTVEAMATGCVPVGYQSGGTAAIVENEESGLLVTLCEHKRLAEAIHRLNDDRDRLARMSLRSSNRAISQYNTKAMGQRYVELIERVYQSPSVSSRLDFQNFQLPRSNNRRYAAIVPSGIRKRINQLISLNPRLEDAARKWKGI
ncbi:Glycosyltransferase involved in cell wall bisynthesis [Neorhodopirellula lusitana]|uniref:Glycosyltransferase involved in cell wall bisynthesis n=1 Tax=Neorhodopirellula lusitana TaxID=445327 RepID=A0ABY1Q8H9_9BACT|nr:glycosyltransferase family 4 protein [Neorhodopirellula lusitana]SMP62075.1 Glycosyltransferase involved in cell wall bisynthesis [Neorhodopirellula lusitana]